MGIWAGVLVAFAVFRLHRHELTFWHLVAVAGIAAVLEVADQVAKLRKDKR